MHGTNGRIRRYERTAHVFLWLEDTLSTCDQIKIIWQEENEARLKVVRLMLVILGVVLIFI